MARRAEGHIHACNGGIHPRPPRKVGRKITTSVGPEKSGEGEPAPCRGDAHRASNARAACAGRPQPTTSATRPTRAQASRDARAASRLDAASGTVPGGAQSLGQTLSRTDRREPAPIVAGSNGAPMLDSRAIGAWRSLVAHLNGVQEVERSNRSAPTNARRPPPGRCCTDRCCPQALRVRQRRSRTTGSGQRDSHRRGNDGAVTPDPGSRWQCGREPTLRGCQRLDTCCARAPTRAAPVPSEAGSAPRAKRS